MRHAFGPPVREDIKTDHARSSFLLVQFERVQYDEDMLIKVALGSYNGEIIFLARD